MTVGGLQVVARAAFAAALVGLVLLGSACSSYRICGFSGGATGRAFNVNGRKFRIVDLRIGFKTAQKGGQFVFTSAVGEPRNQLIARIHAARPDVFSTQDDAERIAVSFTMTAGRREGQASILLYIFSLCTLPYWEDYYSDGVATVSTAGNSGGLDGSAVSVPLKFETSQKITFYSPIGLIPYGDRPDATAMRKRALVMSPHADDLNAVFAVSAADAIARAVVQMQPVRRPQKTIEPKPQRVRKDVTVRKPRSVIPKTSTAEKKDEPVKCPACGAIKDASGKCPLCTGGDN